MNAILIGMGRTQTHDVLFSRENSKILLKKTLNLLLAEPL